MTSPARPSQRGLALVCTTALLAPLPLLATTEPSVLPPSVAPGSGCAVCHQSTVAALHEAQGEDGPHADIECGTCHRRHTFNPHVSGEIDASQEETLEALAVYGRAGADGYLGCPECHEDEVEAWRHSIHGPSAAARRGGGGATCTGCHGSPHLVGAVPPSKRARAERCVRCHAFQSRAGEASEVVDTYRDTVHGKMLLLGNERAAACPDCHGSHDVLPPEDPGSSVHPSRRAKTCGHCHEGADDRFASAVAHVPHRFDTDTLGSTTAFAFSLLTVVTILLLFLHVIADFARSGRRPQAPPRADPNDGAAPDPTTPVRRFDLHMRVQHGLMLLSFITLGVTGWPLKSAATEASLRLAEFFGGQENLALVHRVAGVVMILTSLYHLAYLALRAARGRLGLGLLPRWQDLRDLGANLAYFLGRRSEKPRFGRWTYYEKFDYWAVFWGVVIMCGSGLILWFPVGAADLLSPKLLRIARIAHSDEALLALLAIFLWHFYNVHLRPTVFPMSWVWLTGTLDAEAYYEEHRANYEALFGPKAPRARTTPRPWHARRRWSWAALGVILLAAITVLVVDASAIRARVQAVSGARANPTLRAGEVDQAIPPTASKTNGTTAEQTPPPGPRQVAAVSAAACFACHNEQRFEAGGPFPHRMHFEEQDVEPRCESCHQARWHASLSLSTEPCLECHDADELPLPISDP